MKELQTTEDRRRVLVPASHVREKNGTVEVRIEMPGVAKSEIDIQAEGQKLTVTGRRQRPTVEGTWLVRERPHGDFTKSFSVDATINLEEIEANLANGVLTLILPIKEAAKPRRIDIRSA